MSRLFVFVKDAKECRHINNNVRSCTFRACTYEVLAVELFIPRNFSFVRVEVLDPNANVQYQFSHFLHFFHNTQFTSSMPYAKYSLP